MFRRRSRNALRIQGKTRSQEAMVWVAGTSVNKIPEQLVPSTWLLMSFIDNWVGMQVFCVLFVDMRCFEEPMGVIDVIWLRNDSQHNSLTLFANCCINNYRSMVEVMLICLFMFHLLVLFVHFICSFTGIDLLLCPLISFALDVEDERPYSAQMQQ